MPLLPDRKVSRILRLPPLLAQLFSAAAGPRSGEMNSNQQRGYPCYGSSASRCRFVSALCRGGDARRPRVGRPLSTAQWSPLNLETERPAHEGQRLEYLIGWFGRSDLVRVLAAQHRRVDGAT